jgi:hypothetical protein
MLGSNVYPTLCKAHSSSDLVPGQRKMLDDHSRNAEIIQNHVLSHEDNTMNKVSTKLRPDQEPPLKDSNGKRSTFSIELYTIVLIFRDKAVQ